MKKLHVLLVVASITLLVAGLLIYRNYQISESLGENSLIDARRELKNNMLEQKKLTREQNRLTKMQMRQFNRDKKQLEKQQRKLLKQESALTKDVEESDTQPDNTYSSLSDE